MRNVESSEFSLNIFYSEVLVHSLRSDWLLIWNWLFIYFHFFPLYNYSRPAPTKDNLCYSSKVFEFDNVYFIKLGWQNWLKRQQEEKRRSKAAGSSGGSSSSSTTTATSPTNSGYIGNWMMIFAGEEGVDWPRDLLVPQLHESEGHYCRKPHSFSCLIGCERGIGQVNFPTGWNWHRVGGRWVYSFWRLGLRTKRKHNGPVDLDEVAELGR